MGPLKYIVCLLGSDAYTVNNFHQVHIKSFASKPNLNISIMALTSEEKELHVSSYKSLCNATQGIFVNAVQKEKIDRVAERFFASLDVYPS